MTQARSTKVPAEIKSLEIEGRTYRVLARKAGKKGTGRRDDGLEPSEVVIFRGDGRRYRDGRMLCDHRSRQRFNSREFRASLGDVAPELLDVDRFEFRELASVHDPKHFALCEGPDMKGRNGCHYHGGKALVGAAHPQATDLRRSIYASEGRLGLTASAMLTGAEPDDLAQEIAIERSAIKNVVWPALDTGEAPAVFRELDRIRRQLTAAIDAADGDGLREVVDGLRTLAGQSGRARAAQDLLRHQLAMARLVTAQVARRKALDEVVTQADLDSFELRFSGAMRRLVRTMLAGLPKTPTMRRLAAKALSEATRAIATIRPVVDVTPGNE